MSLSRLARSLKKKGKPRKAFTFLVNTEKFRNFAAAKSTRQWSLNMKKTI